MLTPMSMFDHQNSLINFFLYTETISINKSFLGCWIIAHFQVFQEFNDRRYFHFKKVDTQLSLIYLYSTTNEIRFKNIIFILLFCKNCFSYQIL